MERIHGRRRREGSLATRWWDEMVATLTRSTAACPYCEEERCAENGVSGVEGRERGRWRRRGIVCGSVILCTENVC